MIFCPVLWALLIAAAPDIARGDAGDVCDFEKPCLWDLKDGGFKIVTGQEVNNSWVPTDGHLGGPFTDADNNTNGHFLYLLVKSKDLSREFHVRSPKYSKSGQSCRLTFWSHMYMEQPDRASSTAAHTKYLESGDKTALLDRKSQEGNIKVVIETGVNRTQWVIQEIPGNDHNRWENQTVAIGPQREFNILLVVTPSRKQPHHVAIDNITLTNCFQDQHYGCLPSQFQCNNDSACIDFTSVCDIEKDCPDGEDEMQSCDEVPSFARCDFENGMCGWKNREGRYMNWKFKNGSLTATGTGPSFDHTYKNATGMYIYVDMSGSYKMGTSSELESPWINPPPYYHSNASSPYFNSCYISFFYHKFGPHSGSLGLFIVEEDKGNTTTHRLWWGPGTRTDNWLRTVVILPQNITGRYHFVFEARKSYASRGDPALDDIAMSPKCFGKGVPREVLGPYDFHNRPWLPSKITPPPPPHKDFVNATTYVFTTCGATGRFGPTPEQCEEAYNNTEVEVTVQTEKLLAGIQKWVVPETGFYTLIARGASGGKGSDEREESKGALVRTVVELTKGQHLYILVGQEGTQSCPKALDGNRKSNSCDSTKKFDPKNFHGKLYEISKLNFLSEGGGGGGATYVFTILKNKEKKPLIVAAGGGGLGHGSKTDAVNGKHNGHGINRTLAPVPGEIQISFPSVQNQGNNKMSLAQHNLPAGAGGGWKGGNFTSRETMGLSLLQGGEGGKACYESPAGLEMGAGGFGGGGGGCTSGGGGGGYTGGRAWNQKAELGEGGYSWIEVGFLHRVQLPPVSGPGEVMIIPAIQGCDCDYLCVALDMNRAATQCLCPENWHLSNDSVQCIMNPSTSALTLPNALMGAVFLIILLVGTIFFIYLYSRYLKKKNAMIRRKMLSGPDLQLNRLRVASDSMMTEYNPNYEFGGGVYSLRDLKEIPREHLRLVKALGQGAFGEVYQGLYRHRVGDTVEMPVAVKTLPHLSTSQAETDFLMEALIMSKFNHPNIVHFIGVCFDQHPRFIVIELLAGGDLKTFLRESRPKPDRAVPLTMKDLLSCIIDVAKGCKYMEENRFIHRDIAARNCLLTSKGPGRVVKIADFGMARDIYRADYYRKGGKAMLPIKWMPPEAFLDGIFTTKTDVWSFGVLMWEVLSMGYMPYTGCANREVLQLVTNGGRLAPPTNCPPQLYAIMTQCWQPNPEERPGFGLILERLGYCMQDPDVKRAPLPVYPKPPSSERDTTIMRPSTMEDCIQPDYLIPLPGPQEWDFPDPHLAARSTTMLIESGCESTTTPPSITNMNHHNNTNNINSNNNNPPMVPPISKPHLNNLSTRTEPSPVYTVSSTLKQDTEISC